MNGLISWLSKNRAFTIIVSGIYYAAVVRFHEEVSTVSVWFQTRLSLRLYNKVITVLGVALLIACSIYVLTRIFKGDRKILKAFYWCLTMLIAGVAYNTLMVVNVESIHFPQYAILTLPVFALTMSFGETVLIVTLLGAIDEANQFFILSNWKYLDFNDIILNLTGAAIGVLLIFTLYDKKSDSAAHPLQKLIKSPYFVLTASFLSTNLLLYFAGLIKLYPGAEASGALIVLSKIPRPEKFWISFEWGKTYHILNPVEGLTLSAILIACYAFMDYKPRGINP